MRRSFFALFVIAAVILPVPALLDLARRDFPDRNTKAIWVLAVLLLVIWEKQPQKGALASRASCARASAMRW